MLTPTELDYNTVNNLQKNYYHIQFLTHLQGTYRQLVVNFKDYIIVHTISKDLSAALLCIIYFADRNEMKNMYIRV